MRVLVAGDSWVAGHAGAALAQRLRDAGHDVRVVGLVGAGARRLVSDRSFLDALRLFRPHATVFVLGVNDGGPTSEAAARQVRANYHALFSRAERAGALTLLVPTPVVLEPYRSRMVALRAALEPTLGDRIFDVGDTVEPGDFDGSKFHLRPAAARAWGAVVAERLREAPEGLRRALLDVAGSAVLRLLPIP